MRIKRFSIILIILSLIFMNLLALAENTEKQASYFESNGDLINGWYWLRDSNLKHYAQWTFQNISPGSEDLVLNITALATDRPNGGRGFKAKFKLIYGFPGSGDMGGVFKTKTVILPNVSAPNDPSGYTCQGQVSIDRAFISGASTILVRVERESAGDNHIAFKEDSVTMLAEVGEEGLGEEELEEEEQLPETNTLEEATLIQPGNYTGSLGDKDQEGHRDNADYYSISLEEGQLITLQLTIPGDASYGITLLDPNRNSRGSSTTQGNVKTLDYVANSAGTWYIKISRSSGEGEYQLSVDDFTSGFEGEENHPPIISSLVSSQNSVEANQTVDISCNASDGDGDTLTYNWTANGQSIGENTSSLNWVAPDTPGTYIITCTVSDSKGSQDSDSVSIIVIEPEDGSEQIPTQVLYQIKITTGTKMGAGTDANVYITLVGQNGQSSGEILLDNPGINDFERGNTNIFWINSIPIEGLDYIIIRHDNTGNFPGWYIEEVYIACPELNKDWFFYPRQWLATDEPPRYRTQGTFYPQQEEVQEDSEECLLSLTDSGRTLTSNLSIFVQEDEKGSDIDIDGDGILQEFEDQAMDLINPKFELDEDEDWLEHPEHHVVNFVRVFPYSKGNKQYVIFIYCVTWSRDYGRAGIAGHDGDVERVIMAYEATSESGKNLQLKYVFTSAHGGENDHSAVWDAWNRDCFTCGISFWPRDEEMCGQLVFENNILKLQISEDKHAIYPTKDCCEDVHLVYLAGGFVKEDCGEGDTKRFNCYNAGEPEYYLIDDLDNPSSWRGLSEEKRTSLTNLFSQEQVWSGNKSHPDKFCGGLGGEGSTSDLWMDSPGTIGNKLQSLPNSLTDKL